MRSVMRKGIVCLFFCNGMMGMALSWYPLMAQTGNGADQYFAADQFFKAAALYEQLWERDSTREEVAYRLGECYRRMFSYEKAQQWYALVQQRNPVDFPLSVYYYALMLKYNGHFEEAIAAFDRFMLQGPKSGFQTYIAQAQKEKQGSYLALVEENTADYQFSRLPAPVNTNFQEFAPALLQDDSVLVVTTSWRKSDNGKINNRLGEGFTDQLMWEKREGAWMAVQQNDHFDVTNSRWSDGSGCFNSEKNKYYFTSCREEGFCQLYVSVLKKGLWQKPVVLNDNINVPETNAKHPALSAGGDTLFFVSDRQDGYGGTDLWMSVAVSGESWGPAVNLGKEINTPFNEISPYMYSQEGVFVFASDGHEGLGGMDFYLVEGWPAKSFLIQNLGQPFNASRDEAYMVLGKQTGYLSSNREQSFDIYTFRKPPDVSWKNFLTGYFPNMSATSPVVVFQDIITDRSTHLMPENNHILSVMSGDQESLSNGSTRFILSSDIEDVLLDRFQREVQAARRNQQEASTMDLKPEAILMVDSMKTMGAYGYHILTFKTDSMARTEKGAISGKLLTEKSDSILSAITLHLLTADQQLAKITTTNAQGDFRFSNLKPGSVYHIYVEATQIPQSLDFTLKEIVLQTYGEEIRTFWYENIYFDFNQSHLRKEARIVLEELADLYHQHPAIQIEINAFTDSTGNPEYNLLLSQERGQSAFDFLMAQGVDRSALVINAQGISTAVSSSHYFASQQLNRRVAFEVMGRGIRYEPLYETHILKPSVSLTTVAETLKMSVKEIKSINGLSQEEIQAFKPIRVRKTTIDTESLFYDVLEE